MDHQEEILMSERHEPAPLDLSASGKPRRITKAALTAVLALSPDALVLVNEGGTIVMLNEQIEAFFGYRRQELLSQPLEVLLPERLRAVHVAHRQH
jgi:protein-histidine pros-kinase